jgi:hypothetical protein
MCYYSNATVLLRIFSLYPKYYDAIEIQMDLSTFRKKLTQYKSLKTALQDLRLIWKNCLEFNLSDSSIVLQAIRVGKEAERLIEVRSE